MGLIRWYPFNGNYEDYTANNAGILGGNNVSYSDAGKIGKCCYFDSAQSATIRIVNPLEGKNIFSICFWAKPNTPDSWADIFGFSSNLFRLEKTDSNVYRFYSEGDTAPITSGSTAFDSIPNNVWSHIAISCNGSTWATYLNGNLAYTGTCTSHLIAGTEFRFAQRGGNSSYWKGYLNDFRIYDHALSVKEVKEISKAKMLHYDCNDKTATTRIGDRSGFKNHATIPSANAPAFTRDDCALGTSSFLFANSAQQSNGKYQYFQSTNTVRIPESGTISYYIKYSGTENSDNKYAVGFAQFCSMNNADRLGIIYYVDANYTQLTTNRNLRDGQWHMHTFSWTVGGTFKNYVDGVLIGTNTITTMTHAGQFRTFYVGSAWDLGYGGHSGYLDDIRVYATQLSDADVLELYQTRASVSKNGKMFTNEICELDLSDMTTKNAYDANWVRIFYHNNKSGTVLFSSDKNEFLRCNTTDKQSSLWALERFRDKDGKFELLLEYGDEAGYNRWKQTSDFTKTTAITGYEAVACSWTGNAWGGLALSEDPNFTWVDGSPNSGGGSWWFAIGCKTIFEGGIPGGTKAVTGTVSLWVRTDNASSVKVTKKGIVYATEINEVDNTSMKTKTELNANWVRLFYHNSSAGTVLFSSKDEFLKCNVANKISDLWALEQFRGKDGKFELLLQYQNSTGYNRWKQSSNFTKETIAGYEAVACSWTSNYWGGLEPDTATNTWVDGSVNHSNWFYAIGPRVTYNGGMPGPNNVETGWVEIWVRCDDINLFRMIKGGKCKATEFIEN